MKKKILCMLLTACALTACGQESVPTQEVDYSMVFENQTGLNVSKLEIRPSEDADWSEIALTETEWKNGYEMPVTMQGQMPIAENGWQVQMTFGDSEIQRVWEGVCFDDATTFTFTMEDGDTQVVPSVEAEEAPVESTEGDTQEQGTEQEQSQDLGALPQTPAGE